MCPISAILAFLTLWGSSSGPLLQHQDASPLTGQFLFFLSRLSAERIQGTFSGHSFRIGAATIAAQMGLLDHLIKTMGRWSSDTYQLYVKKAVTTLPSVPGHLAFRYGLVCPLEWLLVGEWVSQTWAFMGLWLTPST